MSTDLDEILKHLEFSKKNESFKVPEGYFDSLPQRINSRITYDSSKSKKTILIRLKPWISLAAVLLIGFLIYTVGFYPHNESSTIKIAFNETDMLEPVLSELSEFELMEYIASDESIEIKPQEVDLTLGLTPDQIENMVLF